MVANLLVVRNGTNTCICANEQQKSGSQATVDGHPALNRTIRMGSTPMASTIYIICMDSQPHMQANKDLFKEFLDGGWLVAIIGAAGMIARLLNDDAKFTLKQQIKKIVTASICSVVVWFLLENVDLGSLTKAIIYGVTGVISPEILQGLTRLARQFAKNPKRFIRK